MKLKTGVDPKCNIRYLGYGILRTLAQRLTIAGRIQDFASVAGEILRFQELEKVPHDSDDLEKYLRNLGTRGATVQDLIYCLYRINFGDGLDIFVEPEAPVIVTQPCTKGVHIAVLEGQPLTLSCIAKGIPSPDYQWHNGARPLVGQNKSNLFIGQASLADHGNYSCSVRNSSGAVQSSTVSVSVQAANRFHSAYPVPAVRLTATNKIALLIGNCNYRCDKPLSAPAFDIIQVGKRLRDMKFKVITCKNLRKNDMLSIIDFFVDLLTEGVYGLLYFAGHGFENYGQCYLVPSDAPTAYVSSDCISAEYVLMKMQNKLPALCVIMLDICRIKNSAAAEQPNDITYEPKPNGNCVVAYATSYGTKAWEKPEISVFVKHLLLFIDKPYPILSLFQEVVASVGRDTAAKDMQFPEVKSNLREFGRTLHDDIISRGHTAEVSRSLELWTLVTELPVARFYEQHYQDLDVKVVFDFGALYSNVLLINIACIKSESSHVRHCRARISKINTCTVEGKAVPLEDRASWPRQFKEQPLCLSVTKNEISGLQLLEQDLNVDVTVEAYSEITQNTCTKVLPCNFARPLIAQLRLPSVIQNPSEMNPGYVVPQNRRAPMECAEFEPVETGEQWM